MVTINLNDLTIHTLGELPAIGFKPSGFKFVADDLSRISVLISNN